jgi:hypothetical protein
MYNSALTICKKYYPYYHTTNAVLLNNIGYLKLNIKKHEEALKYFE